MYYKILNIKTHVTEKILPKKIHKFKENDQYRYEGDITRDIQVTYIQTQILKDTCKQ